MQHFVELFKNLLQEGCMQTPFVAANVLGLGFPLFLLRPQVITSLWSHFRDCQKGGVPQKGCTLPFSRAYLGEPCLFDTIQAVGASTGSMHSKGLGDNSGS
jgi:hypothetical protein